MCQACLHWLLQVLGCDGLPSVFWNPASLQCSLGVMQVGTAFSTPFDLMALLSTVLYLIYKSVISPLSGYPDSCSARMQAWPDALCLHFPFQEYLWHFSHHLLPSATRSYLICVHFTPLFFQKALKSLCSRTLFHFHAPG